MHSVMVFIKRNGVLVACKPYQSPDGMFWVCASCSNLVIRASFGVMSGVLHCVCGADVEIVVDGRPVEVDELNVLPGQPPQTIAEAENQNVAAPQRKRRKKKLTDEEFLRECGIATQGETENA